MKEMNFKEKDMINIFYQAREKKIDEILKRAEERLKNQLKEIDLEKIIENYNSEKKLKDLFNKIEDNYNIKITEYNKEIYKQGFIDGVILILNCLEN